jgi:glycosyltransferase involved in cell wall biosynthesis
LTHNVLHIMGSGRLEGAAIARVVATLARGIDRDKYLLHAWFLDGDGPVADELRELGMPVCAVPWSRNIRDPRGAWRFASGLRQAHISIVHQHIGGRLASWLARGLTGAPLIYHLHTRVLEEFGVAPRRIQPPRANLIIAVSEAVAQSVEGPRPRVVHVGVPVPKIDEWRRLQPPDTVIGIACRLVPVKGLTYLLQAIALLRAEFPTIRLEIAGVGPEQQAIEDQAVSLGIRDRVNLLGWHKQLEPLMARWDIFALPSLDEGFGAALVEAMAMGLPVVASAVGGLLEIVEEGQSGYLVPPADPEALARRLRTLLLDPALRCAMGSAGRERVLKHFSAAAMSSAFTAIYDEILATKT